MPTNKDAPTAEVEFRLSEKYKKIGADGAIVKDDDRPVYVINKWTKKPVYSEATKTWTFDGCEFKEVNKPTAPADAKQLSYTSETKDGHTFTALETKTWAWDGYDEDGIYIGYTQRVKAADFTKPLAAGTALNRSTASSMDNSVKTINGGMYKPRNFNEADSVYKKSLTWPRKEGEPAMYKGNLMPIAGSDLKGLGDCILKEALEAGGEIHDLAGILGFQDQLDAAGDGIVAQLDMKEGVNVVLGLLSSVAAKEAIVIAQEMEQGVDRTQNYKQKTSAGTIPPFKPNASPGDAPFLTGAVEKLFCEKYDLHYDSKVVSSLKQDLEHGDSLTEGRFGIGGKLLTNLQATPSSAPADGAEANEDASATSKKDMAVFLKEGVGKLTMGGEDGAKPTLSFMQEDGLYSRQGLADLNAAMESAKAKKGGSGKDKEAKAANQKNNNMIKLADVMIGWVDGAPKKDKEGKALATGEKVKPPAIKNTSVTADEATKKTGAAGELNLLLVEYHAHSENADQPVTAQTFPNLFQFSQLYGEKLGMRKTAREEGKYEVADADITEREAAGWVLPDNVIALCTLFLNRHKWANKPAKELTPEQETKKRKAEEKEAAKSRKKQEVAQAEEALARMDDEAEASAASEPPVASVASASSSEPVADAAEAAASAASEPPAADAAVDEDTEATKAVDADSGL